MIDSLLFSSSFELLKRTRSFVVFAESLTAGLIASEFAKMPGASSVLWGSYVVYSPYAKEKMLGVPRSLIEKYGVVSAECALSMAEGALNVSFAKDADFPCYSLAVTGLAGPGGLETSGNLLPVGTVFISVAKIKKPSAPSISPFKTTSSVKRFLFEGNRNEIREKTSNAAIKMLIEKLET